MPGGGAQEAWRVVFDRLSRIDTSRGIGVPMTTFTRRRFLHAGAAAIASQPSVATAATQAGRVVKNGRLKQAVSRWPYRSIPLPDFCRAVADMGLTAIDLLDEPDWPVVRQFGLVCSMGYAGGGSIPDGLNVRANHDAI